jgi:uncharacterized protein (DUF1330 family)
VAAYLIADVEVIDEEAYAEYRRRFDGILARFGGSILVAGGVPEPLEGRWQPKRLVILSFPTIEQARSWYTSAEYAEIAPIRQNHARTHFVTLIDGWAEADA